MTTTPRIWPTQCDLRFVLGDDLLQRTNNAPRHDFHGAAGTLASFALAFAVSLLASVQSMAAGSFVLDEYSEYTWGVNESDVNGDLGDPGWILGWETSGTVDAEVSSSGVTASEDVYVEALAKVWNQPSMLKSTIREIGGVAWGNWAWSGAPGTAPEVAVSSSIEGEGTVRVEGAVVNFPGSGSALAVSESYVRQDASVDADDDNGIVESFNQSLRAQAGAIVNGDSTYSAGHAVYTEGSPDYDEVEDPGLPYYVQNQAIYGMNVPFEFSFSDTDYTQEGVDLIYLQAEVNCDIWAKAHTVVSGGGAATAESNPAGESIITSSLEIIQ